jgi:signal transduction histidine kinase
MDRAHFSSVGLKLTLAKLLIELHGGDIRIEAQPDGDTFTVRMPIVESQV